MGAKRIGILTGGGDVPGLNSVIKTVVYRGSEIGCEVIGIRRGWEGLTHVNLQDPASRTRYVLPLNRENTRTIDRTGGTYLHSSRTNPSKMKKLPPVLEGQDFPLVESTKKGVTSSVFDVSKAVLKNIETLALDYLIAIGGDDTLSYAAALDRLGMKVMAVPKTMDNDVRNTEYCIGFSTAITRAMDAIERQRTTVGSHERIGLFRVFGRDAGYTALYTAYVTSTRCCIPEYKVNLEKLIETAGDGQAQQSEQLLAGDSQRGRGVGRLHREGIRRAGRVRPSQEDERDRRPEQRAEGSHRRRDHRQRPDLRLAVGQRGLRGPYGRIDVRGHGDGCDLARRPRQDDGNQQRHVLAGATFRIPNSDRARWTWRTCTTRTATVRATITSWAFRFS